MAGYRRIAILLAAAACASPLTAGPVDTIKTRIANYRELGAAFKAVNDGVRGELQVVLVQQSARQIRNSARQQYTLFPAGTGPEAGVKTAAKPEIWTRPAQFKAAQDVFAIQAAAFDTAVKGGKVEAIRTATRKLGAACKGCHDQFRVPKD
jgi:cytochrome c556